MAPSPLFLWLAAATLQVASGLAQASADRSAVAPSLLSLGTLREHVHRRAHRHESRRGQLSLDQDPAAGVPEIPLTTPPPRFNIWNVTAPTLAPPVPQLEPWKDVQPVDTALGTFVVSGFQERPTSTPPPTQASLDVVRAGCPMLLAWPLEVMVVAQNPCLSYFRPMWQDVATGRPLIEYSQSCSPMRAGATPLTSYRLVEGGHVLAQTQMYTTLTGNRFAVMDCQGNVRYELEEKVFHQRDGFDARSCEKYHSCDGIVWIQYFIFRDGKVVAQTPYLHIFEATVMFVDPKTGLRIATATRIGNWDPTRSDCMGDRKWHLAFAPVEEQPPTPFAVTTEQWVLAATLSIVSQRDAMRRPSGFVSPSWCELWKGTSSFLLLAGVLSVLAVGSLLFLRDVVPPLTAGLYQLEQRLCRRRMTVPSKYHGP